MVNSEKLIERYRALKAEVPGCLLLMQVGAFMPVMDEDARAVSAVTGLKPPPCAWQAHTL
jgi:DNA mismatch repair ATPase MutS